MMIEISSKTNSAGLGFQWTTAETGVSHLQFHLAALRTTEMLQLVLQKY